MEGQASTRPEARFGLALSAWWKAPPLAVCVRCHWPNAACCECLLGRWGSSTPSAGGAQQNLHRRLAKYSLLTQSMTLIWLGYVLTT